MTVICTMNPKKTVADALACAAALVPPLTRANLELARPAKVRPTGRHAPLIGHHVRHLRHHMKFLNDKGKAHGQNGNGSHTNSQ